jgi:hypothetical protein
MWPPQPSAKTATAPPTRPITHSSIGSRTGSRPSVKARCDAGSRLDEAHTTTAPVAGALRSNSSTSTTAPADSRRPGIQRCHVCGDSDYQPTRTRLPRSAFRRRSSSRSNSPWACRWSSVSCGDSGDVGLEGPRATDHTSQPISTWFLAPCLFGGAPAHPRHRLRVAPGTQRTVGTEASTVGHQTKRGGTGVS